MPELVLASTSPWRRKLLEDAGFPVRCVAPGVDERAARADGPVALARTLAAQKAEAVAAGAPEAWVIGADQVVHLDGQVFGKPADADDHLAHLRAMRGRTHELVTGWALRGPGAPAEGVVTTRLTMRADLSDDELAAYVATGEGAGCAGGYAIEARGAALFERIDGDWFNIVGLPLLPVIGALRERGWRLVP